MGFMDRAVRVPKLEIFPSSNVIVRRPLCREAAEGKKTKYYHHFIFTQHFMV